MRAPSLLRITAISAHLTAVAAAAAVLIGWLAFSLFGAVTMVYLFVALNLALLFAFAGMVVGSLAAACERQHPVVMAILADALLCPVLMVSNTQEWADAEVVNYLVLLTIPVAAIRAWRESNRRKRLIP